MQARRRFPHAFKQQLVEATLQPGASIASVALEHRINANQLHRWRQEMLRNHQAAPVPAELVPVRVVSETAATITPKMSQSYPPDSKGTLTIEFAQAKLSVSGSIDPVLLETAIRLLR